MEVPAPVPGDDEILLSVSARGICRTDLHVVEGELEVRRSQRNEFGNQASHIMPALEIRYYFTCFNTQSVIKSIYPSAKPKKRQGFPSSGKIMIPCPARENSLMV